MKKVAVLLFNLGGPLVQADVKPFLYNLFSDKFIIGLPTPFRQIIAKLISTRREASAQANYRYMGGGSPIVKETEAQARALEAHLNTTPGIMFKAFIGMRYWHPFISEAIADIEAWGADEIVALPLYPQYSTTTSLSSFVTFKATYKGKAPISYVCCYPENSGFTAAYAENIRSALSGLTDLSSYRLLFSAHGLPEKVISGGDPYQAQIEASVSQIMAQLNLAIDHVVSYQSRVGPLKWIGPSTDETIVVTVKGGKSPVVVPVAFVSEHIETLVELDIEYRHLADKHGAKDYIRVPVVGVNTAFIKGLADEVHKALNTDADIVADYSCQACHKQCAKQRGF
ncbi:ferrochelatase [Asticcacaulis sp. YBE204]|uniref:ferrochelatase n=1 Tax=Asticcacaulis sp. YBE204 TaxID=1282363 RepID=UPI0003C3CE0D|nr:ferrochelatase [Asticcacaulis sp. YBE204]ESQ80921.1 ferrochelatase [Asticcacaulis sp. YBE204]